MFVFYNPNPERISAIDCVIRAISKLLEQDWETTYSRVVFQGFFLHDMPSSDIVWGEYLKSIGYEMALLPSCPNCYTVKEFCELFPTGRFVVKTSGHVVAVVNGDYYDSWDSGNEIVQYFWKRRSD